jgi:hypothetical protein
MATRKARLMPEMARERAAGMSNRLLRLSRDMAFLGTYPEELERRE